MAKDVPESVEAQFAQIKQAEQDEMDLFRDLGLSAVHDRLEKDFRRFSEVGENRAEESMRFQQKHDMRGGEIFFVPDSRWYRKVLELVPAGVVVADIGAGDLRFSMALATKAERVYAVEINPSILGPALTTIGYDLPTNVLPICADAFSLKLPVDVSVVVCILIHRCHDFPEDWLSRKIIHAEFSGVKVSG